VLRVTTSTTADPARSLSGGTYTTRCVLLAFDTSTLADDAVITGAFLRFSISGKTDSDGRNLTGESYAWDGTSASDFTNTPSAGAFSIALSAISTTSASDVSVATSAISTTGLTRFRVHIDGGQPTGINKIDMRMSENASGQKPQLLVSYAVAPYFRAKSSVSTYASAIALSYPTDPTPALEGDLLLATIGAKGGTGVTITPPDGWQLAANGRVNSGTALAGALYWKIATGSEPGSYSFSLDQTRHVGGEIVAYAAPHPGSPFDTVEGQANASSASVEAPSVNAQYGGERLIFLGVTDGVASFTPPSGMTERVDQAG
jgi:hypothetical protein